MQPGPDITRIAALIGERGRAQILMALMAGRALTATELADAAGVSRPTASSHLARLISSKLIVRQSQGRHRYFRIADRDVAALLEGLMGVAYRLDPQDVSTGPRDPALRKARMCYDHLAGEFGVLVYDALEQRRLLNFSSSEISVTDTGWRVFGELGIVAADLQSGRRPVCRACLDWSERRHHLAGALGAALTRRFIDLRWAAQEEHSRVVCFSQRGEKALRSFLSA